MNDRREYTDDEKEMSELLSSQYKSVFSKPRCDISDENFIKEIFSEEDMTGKPNINNIFMDREYLEENIKKLPNNAAIGPDGVSVRLIKHGGNKMIDAIADIGMSSLNKGKIPMILKIGWITPIWKGNERDIPSDYRPISLTSHIGKLIERVVRHQLTIYLEYNNLIDNEQHGSRTGRTTDSA